MKLGKLKEWVIQRSVFAVGWELESRCPAEEMVLYVTSV